MSPLQRALKQLASHDPDVFDVHYVDAVKQTAQWALDALNCAEIALTQFNQSESTAKRLALQREKKQPATPLTIEQINAMPEATGPWPHSMRDRVVRLIRAVERAHRIGAQPDAPLQFDPEPACWCHRCRSGLRLASRMIVCPTCGNKRCPRASDHDLPCTGSNEPGQPGSVYFEVAPLPSACGLTECKNRPMCKMCRYHHWLEGHPPASL